MTKENFIEKYGDNPQEVTRNYSAKSVGTNYDVNDCFNEFIDNIIDAKVSPENCVNAKIFYDDAKHTLTVEDDGTGIKDPSKLFLLGGTDKEKRSDSIGKYGIGVKGATASIATNCRYDSNKEVLVEYESAYKGKKFSKTIGYFGDELYIGDDMFEDCNPDEHYTKFMFTNVTITNISDIIDSMEETFEIPLSRNNGISIMFNNRALGRTGRTSTFVGDETKETIMVGNHPTELAYRIIGNATQSDRAFEESGIRIYDKTTGRLLGKNTKYWEWYAGKEAQQNICGLRCGLFIEGSIECYTVFGILPAKNGIKYKKYYKQDEFSELSDRLKEIYRQSAVTKGAATTDDLVIDGKRYILVPSKLDGELYKPMGDNEIFVKNKYKTEEVIRLIAENMSLKKKLERKERKSNKTEE